jgi:hypothetical protein
VPDASILRTTVLQEADCDIVQLEISDSRLASGEVSIEEGAAIRVTVEARIRPSKGPQLAYLQIQSIDAALEALQSVKIALGRETAGHGLHPPRNPA